MEKPSFLLGATSYSIEAGLVANAHYLADKVQDMELVLFDLDDGTSNLPDANTIKLLNAIADEMGIGFTVHLPLDLHCDPQQGGDHPSLVKALKVMDCTRDLSPRAYIAHLDGREIKQPSALNPVSFDIWRSQACRALEMVAGWAGAPDRIVLENLEGYPIDLLEPIFDQVPVSRCVDIGHLWLDGRDPLPYLFRALDRTRVIHIHGVHHQDHQSLAHVPHNELDRVLATLVEHQYTGILTMEVFGEDDFNSSRTAIYDSLQRLNLEG